MEKIIKLIVNYMIGLVISKDTYSVPNVKSDQEKSQQNMINPIKETYMITREEVLMGRDKKFPLDSELETNLQKLLIALNKFRNIYGKPMKVTSGYRPGGYNQAAGGAKKSNHMICLACDFRDSDGALDKYCMDNLHVLEQCGLYLEHPDATSGWCHLQCVPPRSGNRVFRP